LKKNGQLEAVGGAYYLAQLTNNIASSAHITSHAKIVSEAYLKRAIKQSCLSLVSDVEKQPDAFELLQKYTDSLHQIEDTIAHNNLSYGSEALTDLLVKLSKNKAEGVRTGLPSLDRLLNKAGWRKGEMSVIAARPGQGKTALMVNFALEALKDPAPGAVLFFSVEMNTETLMSRIVARESCLGLDKISEGALDAPTQNKILETTSWLADKQLIIDDSSSLTPLNIYTQARIAQRKHGLKVVIVDYLQIVTTVDKRLYNREQEVSSIARFLKALAKELNVPVIVGSQMNRQYDHRVGGGARLSDLRESDAIGNEADCVFFIQDRNDPGGYVELLFAKHRNGATGTIPLIFDKPTQRFRETGRVGEF
jgi:replicative DNA helicase